jgi:hypothetical protein
LVFYYYIIHNNKMEQLYLEQLTLQERKAHDIAKSHLGTSFDIVRSNGYKSWMKKRVSSSGLTPVLSPSGLSPELSSSGPSPALS